MRTQNRAEILGNAVADAVFSEIGESRTSMAKFTVATNRGPDGEEVTEHHRVVAFARLADQVAAKLRKGCAVYVSGRLEYDDKGRVEIHAREVSFP